MREGGGWRGVDGRRGTGRERDGKIGRGKGRIGKRGRGRGRVGMLVVLLLVLDGEGGKGDGE